MKILFCGDIVGRSGRKAVTENIPILKKKHQIDFIIANVDNASGGFGVNRSSCNELIDAGVDVLTGGDHIWDQKEASNFLTDSKKLLRPLNFPKSLPGTGARIYSANNQDILVIHLLGQVFIKNNLNCPFQMVEELINSYKLKSNVDVIVVDFHAEATSEKMAMGKFLDGKASLVIGTHTHIPTNDFHIMKNGTAYQTDAGMCGDYDSIIGMEESVPLKMFFTKRKAGRMSPAKKEATFCATLTEINDETGLAKSITAIKIGGVLENQNLI